MNRNLLKTQVGTDVIWKKPGFTRKITRNTSEKPLEHKTANHWHKMAGSSVAYFTKLGENVLSVLYN